MKDEKLNSNTPENNTIPDEMLKDVSGGMAFVQFGGSGATFQLGEGRVRIINGKSCPKCGNTIGWISLGNTYSGVKCDGCNTIILESYTSDDIEMI
jgi:hypothetical protein